MTGMDFISGFDPATTLADVLQRMVTEYPTDPEGTLPAALLTIAHPTSGAAHTIPLPPEAARWFELLVGNELTTCRNAHLGESGACGHCRGTGLARPSLADDPDPYDPDWHCTQHGESGMNEYACGDCAAEARIADSPPDVEDIERIEVDFIGAADGKVHRTATVYPRPGETAEQAIERAKYSARTGRLTS